LQNVERRVLVPIQHQPAMGAGMDTHAQRLGNHLAAGRTHLGCVLGIHENHPPPSFFRGSTKRSTELTPKSRRSPRRPLVAMDALLVKQVVSTDWASPPLALCYPIELRVSDVVGLAVFRPACRPIGVQGWVVGRGGASHLDVSGDFGGGESEQVVVPPLSASVTRPSGKDPAVAPNPPEVSWDDPSHPFRGVSRTSTNHAARCSGDDVTTARSSRSCGVLAVLKMIAVCAGNSPSGIPSPASQWRD
jgi:hypothetical protein